MVLLALAIIGLMNWRFIEKGRFVTMNKVQKVWLVCLIDKEPEIYGTAQKAYEAIRDYIEKHYDADDGVDQMLDELVEDYMNFPTSFGVEDVGGANEHYVL